MSEPEGVRDQQRDLRYRIEYAKSSRSTCKVCGEKIEKEIIRVGVPGFFQDYLTFKWQHLTCTATGGAVPPHNEMAGFNELSATDQEKLLAERKVIDNDSIPITPLSEVVVPNTKIPRIIARVVRVGQIQDDREMGGTLHSSISIEDETGKRLVAGFGTYLAKMMSEFEYKGKYTFFNLEAGNNREGRIILRYGADSKHELLEHGVKLVMTDSPEKWGKYYDNRLTVSSRSARCTECQGTIANYTYRITVKGTFERTPGKTMKVDKQNHIECSKLDA
ncbi:MAG TPA: PARP-type zinc finger-containing protein, partial [Candidatus Hodarchaeales archaeon]|nr:PARP-type zinc finger-containing protein [Candidatus Hodarchaeales archaeon]